MTEPSTRRSYGKATDSALRRSRLPLLIAPVASVLIICIALWFLHRELAGLSWQAITAHIKSVPTPALLASLAFMSCSYLVLSTYDMVALRYLGCSVSRRRSMLTAFMAFAVGNNVGVAALSGGSIRYRMYTLAGLTAFEIARLIVFVTATFLLGASGLLGLAFLLMPDSQTAVLNIKPSLVTFAGCLLLAVPFGYLAIAFLRKAPVQLGSARIEVPPPQIALAQLTLSVTDLILSAATLFVLLAPSAHMGFFPFLGIYLLAIAAGVISNVPGGIGVFEAVLVAALPGVDAVALIGTIIIYRLIYYVAPLATALLLLVGHESRRHGQMLLRSSEKAGDFLSGIAPQVISTAVFLAGVVLLVSGASPAVETRLSLIARGIPLPILELSHLGGSVIGVALLILARGLYRRLNSAYLATLIALAVGAAISLVKGLDYEEALVMTTIIVVLWFSRDEFYRRGSVAEQRFPAPWIAATVVVFCLTFWVILVSFRHVEYSNELWWQFAFNAEAPRVLRAGMFAVVTALAFALWKVLRSGPGQPLPAAVTDELERVRPLVALAPESSANAALLGDKRFLWSADQQAFIMYRVSGNSWIALGDPVGPPGYHQELAWAYRELVDRYDGLPVFYQVGDEHLSLYVDLGLTLSKLGEDARVPLAGFSLQGSHRADLRQADNRAKKYGATFEIVPRAETAAIMQELRRVSDGWLADKATAEKEFSLGSFSEAYMQNFECAVVRVNQVIVAFASLWPGAAGGEISVDLMRYHQDAPKGIMDYLFAELLLWGSASGYQWFNLGMAPLSGLEQHALAPLWHKLGHLVFTHGENFYNFEGLRHYKEKFNPVWKPRYLACPDGWWNLSRALLDASRLISGGVAGILSKK